MDRMTRVSPTCQHGYPRYSCARCQEAAHIEAELAVEAVTTFMERRMEPLPDIDLKPSPGIPHREHVLKIAHFLAREAEDPTFDHTTLARVRLRQAARLLVTLAPRDVSEKATSSSADEPGQGCERCAGGVFYEDGDRCQQCGRSEEDARAKFAPPRDGGEAVIDAIVQSLCDLDPTDYPDDDPDTLRVSVADLRGILTRHLNAETDHAD